MTFPVTIRHRTPLRAPVLAAIGISLGLGTFFGTAAVLEWEREKRIDGLVAEIEAAERRIFHYEFLNARLDAQEDWPPPHRYGCIPREAGNRASNAARIAELEGATVALRARLARLLDGKRPAMANRPDD